MSEPEKIKTIFSSSNYFDFNGGVESLNMLGASTGYKGLNLSLGLGVDSSYKLFSDNQDSEHKFAFEGKAKYNINEYINTQARFRKIGESEQYRVTFGGNYKFNKNNSIYASAHLTTKHTPNTENKKEWKSNYGAWIGFTHTFSNNCSISAEFQQNIPFKDKPKASDTMVNFMFSIPL